MKKRLAILGSCCSRDVFNKNFIPEWRDYFDLEIDGFANSIVSLMSSPIPVNRITKRNDIHDFGFNAYNFYYEVEKDFIYGILSTQPEVILLDFYADACYGVYEISREVFLTKSPKGRWDNVNGFRSLGATEWVSVLSEYDNYMRIFQESLDKFLTFVKKSCPNSLIILNGVQLSNEILNDDGTIKELYLGNKEVSVKDRQRKEKKYTDKEKFDIMSKALNQMNEYAKKKWGLVSIESGRQYINPNYIHGGAGVVHFFNSYHKYIFEQIILLSKEKEVPNCLDSDLPKYNLLPNGKFIYKTLFWDLWDEKFKINSTEHSIGIEDLNNDEFKYHQIWSSAIHSQIDMDYTVSFDINIHELDTGNTKPIFLIRMFDNRGYISSKDSFIEHKIFPLVEDQLGVYRKVKFSFKAETSYFRVACYLAKSGSVEWKNITVTRGKEKLDNDSQSIIEDLMLTDRLLNDVNNLYL